MTENTNEREAVRTTIVSGRPPGSGRQNVPVPRGIEVLLKKAAVDPEFRLALLEQREGAAAAIELQLDPAEQAMLKAIPDEQLKLIIGQTSVPLEQRRVFLGRVAAAMLATISAGLAGCREAAVQPVAAPGTAGIRPPPLSTDGIRPDRPATNPTNAPASTNSPIVVPPPKTRGVQPDRPQANLDAQTRP